METSLGMVFFDWTVTFGEPLLSEILWYTANISYRFVCNALTDSFGGTGYNLEQMITIRMTTIPMRMKMMMMMMMMTMMMTMMT